MKFLIALLLLLTNDVALGCLGLTSAQLLERLRKENVTELVFFASWCASCKKHLTPDQAESRLFIAVFDEQAAAQKAFTTFMGDEHAARCIWDRDGSIAAYYSVKGLPVVRPLANGR
jgi:thiol-disulfide isomerase/thioredoxin